MIAMLRVGTQVVYATTRVTSESGASLFTRYRRMERHVGTKSPVQVGARTVVTFACSPLCGRCDLWVVVSLEAEDFVEAGACDRAVEAASRKASRSTKRLGILIRPSEMKL